MIKINLSPRLEREVQIYPSREAMNLGAACSASVILRETIARQGKARFIVATGASQMGFLAALTSSKDIDWSRTELFHLDEYIGLPMGHPASFRRYLFDRLIAPAGIKQYHLLDGEADPVRVCREVGEKLCSAPIDVAFVGIGENGHLAFNDPPADFETCEPYIVVELDEACRRQQLGEGWFAALEDVPKKAISMSIRQILAAKKILCIVPDARKARAVAECLTGEISPKAPASALQWHWDVRYFLDTDSAAQVADKLNYFGNGRRDMF